MSVIAEPRPTIDVPARDGGVRGLLGVHPGPLLVVVAALVLPRTGISSTWIFSVSVGYILAISCLGLLAVVGWVREISLMQAGLTGCSLYLAQGFATGRFGTEIPFPIAALYGIGFAVGVSLLVALVSIRLAGVYAAVLTLSVQFVLENAVMRSDRLMGGWESRTQPRPDFFGASLDSDKRFYYLVLAVLLVSMVFLYRFRQSRFGRSMIMVGSDPTAAAAVGVSPPRYRACAFLIAGLFAGVAGALSGPLFLAAPGTLQYISFNSLFYVAIPILAGCDSLMTVAGLAVLFTLLPQMFLDAKLNVYLLGGFGLAVGVLLGPRGFSGALTDVFDGSRRRRVRFEDDEPPRRDWGEPGSVDIGTIDLG